MPRLLVGTHQRQPWCLLSTTVGASASHSSISVIVHRVSPTPVAIVTAASRGIGAGCAQALANANYRTVLLARSAEVESVAAEIGGVGVIGSITNSGDVNRVISTALDRFGRIDVAVINTGHPAKGELLTLDDASWQGGYELLLLPVIRLSRLLAPIMRTQGGGSIVNISSLWAVEPNLDAPVSSTFRAAVSAFTKLFADANARFNVRMNTVLAGFVNTHDVPEHLRAAIPLQRLSTPDEIGEVVVFLASSRATYMTGQSVRVDGGLTRSF
jgi:NAD(P)-dependent dehydrogenase (short-subunit alcohol dehydrogenase family)